MSLQDNTVINIYSIIILIIIYVHSLKHGEKELIQNKLFIAIVQITMLMLVVDIISRFDGRPDTLLFPLMNQLGNLLIFMLNPLTPALWLLYVHYQIHNSGKSIKPIIFILSFILIVNSTMLVLSQINGWYYYIDSNNIYHRGPYFWIATSITGGLILAAFIKVLINKDKIEKPHLFALIFFGVPPFVCVILQFTFYGVSIVLNGIVVSVLIVFLNIQSKNLYTDFLTGIYNRKKMEMYLKSKICTANEEKSFSAVLIDIDNFKKINDDFGHDIGDNALQISAKIIISCIKKRENVFRFGGDEFCLILDTCDTAQLESTVKNIKDAVEYYSTLSVKPYKLSFSMGYAVYDFNSHMSAEEFQKKIDVLMYENKRASREI